MKQRLPNFFRGEPFPITGWDNNWMARLLGRSFALWRFHFYQFFFKTNPKAPADKIIRFSTHEHETGHTGQYEDAKGEGLVQLVTFLFSYFGKAIVRRICFAIGKGEWAPRGLYEDNASRQGAEDWTYPPETREHFG